MEINIKYQQNNVTAKESKGNLRNAKKPPHPNNIAGYDMKEWGLGLNKTTNIQSYFRVISDTQLKLKWQTYYRCMLKIMQIA